MSNVYRLLRYVRASRRFIYTRRQDERIVFKWDFHNLLANYSCAIFLKCSSARLVNHTYRYFKRFRLCVSTTKLVDSSTKIVRTFSVFSAKKRANIELSCSNVTNGTCAIDGRIFNYVKNTFTFFYAENAMKFGNPISSYGLRNTKTGRNFGIKNAILYIRFRFSPGLRY